MGFLGFLCFHGNFRRKGENPSGEDEAVAPRKVRRSRVKPRQTEPDPRISELHTYIEPRNIIAPRPNAGNPSTARQAGPGARLALDPEPEPWTVAAVERRISQLEMENRFRLSHEAESERRRRQTYDKIRTEEMMTGRPNLLKASVGSGSQIRAIDLLGLKGPDPDVLIESEKQKMQERWRRKTGLGFDEEVDDIEVYFENSLRP